MVVSNTGCGVSDLTIGGSQPPTGRMPKDVSQGRSEVMLWTKIKINLITLNSIKLKTTLQEKSRFYATSFLTKLRHGCSSSKIN